MQVCNQDILIRIIARSFKLGQSIEGDEYRRLPGENKKKNLIFFSNYCTLQIWTLKICNQDRSTSKSIIARTLKICNQGTCILKSIIARSFNLGQLIEDDE